MHLSLSLFFLILLYCFFDALFDMPSDGAFCYVLKKLEDAERDNDKICGVIRGSHISVAGPEEGIIMYMIGSNFNKNEYSIKRLIQRTRGTGSRAIINNPNSRGTSFGNQRCLSSIIYQCR